MRLIFYSPVPLKYAARAKSVPLSLSPSLPLSLFPSLSLCLIPCFRWLFARFTRFARASCAFLLMVNTWIHGWILAYPQPAVQLPPVHCGWVKVTSVSDQLTTHPESLWKCPSLSLASRCFTQRWSRAAHQIQATHHPTPPYQKHSCLSTTTTTSGDHDSNRSATLIPMNISYISFRYDISSQAVNLGLANLMLS